MKETLEKKLVIKEIKYLIEHADEKYHQYLRRTIAVKLVINQSELEVED